MAARRIRDHPATGGAHQQPLLQQKRLHHGLEGDGVIIAKGQPLFKVTPDEKVEVLSDDELAARQREHTAELVKLFI